MTREQSIVIRAILILYVVNVIIFYKVLYKNNMEELQIPYKCANNGIDIDEAILSGAITLD